MAVRERPQRTRRDLAAMGGIWVLLTIAGEWWAMNADLHPLGISREADIVDEAFDLLVYLGLPVFTFVLTFLGYALVRFRARDETDGPPSRTDRRFVAAWVAISTFLAVFVIFNPGFSGLAALEEDQNADLTIEVHARQWNWSYTYVDYDLSVDKARELVIPVDTRVRFLVTSEDVIHSFWIPAFRVKVDAVPGKTTETWVTATHLAVPEDDPNLRVQCAELCGTGHARMRTALRVVDQSDFQAWVESTREGTG